YSATIARVTPSKAINAQTTSAIPPRTNSHVSRASFMRGSRRSAASRIAGIIAKPIPTGIATTTASRRLHHSLKRYVHAATEARPKTNASRWRPVASTEGDPFRIDRQGYVGDVGV